MNTPYAATKTTPAVVTVLGTEHFGHFQFFMGFDEHDSITWFLRLGEFVEEEFLGGKAYTL